MIVVEIIVLLFAAIGFSACLAYIGYIVDNRKK